MNQTVKSEEKCASGISRAVRNCSWSHEGAVWSKYEIIKCYELPQSSQSNTSTTVKEFVDGYLSDQENKTVTPDIVGEFVKDLSDVMTAIENDTEEITDDTISDLTGQLDKAIKVENQTEGVQKSIINTLDNLVDILDEKQKSDTKNDIGDEKQEPNEVQGPMSQPEEGKDKQNEEEGNLSKENSEAILQLIEDQAQSIGERGDNFTVIGDNIEVHIHQIKTERPTTKTPIRVSMKSQSRNPESQARQDEDDEKEEDGGLAKDEVAAIEIPLELLQDHFKEDEKFPLSVVLHHSYVLFQDEVTEREGKAIASVVMSASTPKEIKNLTVPIVLVFDLKMPAVTPDKKEEEEAVKNETKSNKCENMKYKHIPVCVFWDHNKTGGSGWSTEGCATVYQPEEDIDVAKCLCNHLTNFAVLMDLQGDVENVGLDIFSKIGCGISIVSLCITIVTFLCIKKLRNSRPQQIVLQICIALLGLYVTFLGGIDRTEIAIVCDVITGLIHFFSLASVAWMSVEATNMYRLFVKVHNRNSRFFMLIASLFAWGFPACVVITNAVIQITSHEERQKYDWRRQYLAACSYCFLDHTSNGFLFGMVGILAVLLSYTLLLFAMVSWKLTIGRKRMQTSSANKRQETLRRLQNVFAISVLMGITWFSGFFSLGQLQLSNITFCVSNSLQGFLIFILFCVRQKDIRSAWKNSILARSLSSQRSRTSRRATKLKPVKEDSKVPDTGDSSEMSKFATRNNYEDFKTISETLAAKQHTDSAQEAALDESGVYMGPTVGRFYGVGMNPPPDLICRSSRMTTFKGHVGQLIDISTDEDAAGKNLSTTDGELDVTSGTTLVVTPSTPTSIHESVEQSSLPDSDDDESKVKYEQCTLTVEHPYAMIRADARKADTLKNAPVVFDSDSSPLLSPPKYSMR